MQTTEQIERSVQRLTPGQAVVASLLAHGVDTCSGSTARMSSRCTMRWPTRRISRR